MIICVSKKKILILRSIVVIIILVFISGLIGCSTGNKNQGQVKAKTEVDSAMMAQMQKNVRLADMADKECGAKVEESDRRYAMDIIGFWYSKTVHNEQGDSLHMGDEVEIHMQVKNLDGKLLLDSKHPIVIGEDEEVMAVKGALRMMQAGEEMQIITPWYAAYGMHGTEIIAPYSNLEIILTVKK